MADRNKFEEMLEKLVAEDRKGAEELFHEIVVEKSRTIYENLLSDDVKELDVAEEKKDEEVDEASKEDDKEVDEASKDESEEDKVEEASEEKDEETTEATDEEEKTEEGIEEITPEAPEMGGDPADDMIDDVEDAMDGDKEGEEKGEDDEDIEDRVVDLEDALDDLKSEFEKMMGDKEEKADDEEDSEEPMGDMGDEEKEDEALEPTSELGELPVEEIEPAYEGKKSEGEVMREYVNKIAMPKGEDNKAKSPVAGANNMGGTTANIVAGGEGDTKGSAMTPKEDNAGNVNVPGGKASKSMSNAKGHGAEKKGAGESGTDKKSVIGS